jgi:hypothetical protein
MFKTLLGLEHINFETFVDFNPNRVGTKLICNFFNYL